MRKLKLIEVLGLCTTMLSLTGCHKAQPKTQINQTKINKTLTATDIIKVTRKAKQNISSGNVTIVTSKGKSKKQILTTKFSTLNNISYRKLSVQSHGKETKFVEMWFKNDKAVGRDAHNSAWLKANGNGKKIAKETQVSLQKAINAFTNKNLASKCQATQNNGQIVITYNSTTPEIGNNTNNNEAQLVLNSATDEITNYTLTRTDGKTAIKTSFTNVNELDALKIPKNARQAM